MAAAPRLKLIPIAIVALPPRSASWNEERWRNGLAVAPVIWWHDRPLWAFPRMRSDARGYPSWPGTQTFRSRAGYRSARPITSKSSLSACNARPVHTDHAIDNAVNHRVLGLLP